MQKTKNQVIFGSEGKPIALDIFYPADNRQPLVLYAHGFNGFKDWGNFDLIAAQFAEAGFCFGKFNFSHNGTAPETPEEFTDIEAFGNNKYSRELEDLERVMNWLLSRHNPHRSSIDERRIYLIGHSRGGGMVLLKAAEDDRVKGVATWASVAECKTPWGSWPQERLDRWKETGVEQYTNSRTKQQMPLYYQLYEDYQNNRERLDILRAVGRLKIPLLICHGTKDEAVPVQKAYQLAEAAKSAELFFVESDHVFGRKHPWPHPYVPEAMHKVLNATIIFFKRLAAKTAC